MNSSKTNNILQNINTNIQDKEELVNIGATLTQIELDTTSIATRTSQLYSITSYTSDMDISLNNIESDIDNINTNISTINDNIADIGITTNIINTNISNIDTNTTNVDSKLSTTNTTLSTIDTSLNNIESDIDNINTNISTINTNISNIDTSINNIETDIDNINTNISSLLSYRNENKEYVRKELIWANNKDWLQNSDYSSSNVVGRYENTDSRTLYITKYSFTYVYNDSTLPDAWMYHNSSFTTTIGNYDGSNFQTPSWSMNRNNKQYQNYVYQNGLLDATGYKVHLFVYDFKDNPIKISQNDYFGHLIGADWSSYDAISTKGIVEGYYIDS